MKSNYDSKLIDLDQARMVKQSEHRNLYLGHRDERVASLRTVRHPKKPNYYDLPLVGPNRIPPEYLAA